MADKPMTIQGRILYVKKQIINAAETIKESQRIGGHSCYAVGFEQGLLAAFNDELEFLEDIHRRMNKYLYDGMNGYLNDC